MSTNNKGLRASVLRFTHQNSAFGPAGYYWTRSLQPGENLASLPFADFYDYAKVLAKKYWLDGEGKFKGDTIGSNHKSLMPLYSGILLTVQRIVPLGFFTFSALLVYANIHMAALARSAGCPADIWSLREKLKGPDAKALHETLVACRVASTIMYEGDGLGGYNDKAWKLYGRLFGIGCPEDNGTLSTEDAMSASKLYRESNNADKRELFWEWWNMLHADLHLSREIVDKVWMGTRLVARYQQLEAGDLFNPFDPNKASDVQSVVCGFARRASKGISEGRSLGATDAADRFFEFLWDNATGDVIPQAKALFTLSNGKLSPFGAKLLGLVGLYVQRAETIGEIQHRQEQADVDPQADDYYAAMGITTELAKKGRR